MANIRGVLFFALSASGCAFQAAQAEDCKPLQIVASIDMAPSDDALVAPVTLNGKPKYMIVDSGGAFSEITPDTAAELGITPVHRGFSEVDVTGGSADMLATVPDFTLGQLVSHKTVFVVTNNNFGDKIAGLIGPNILKQYDVELDFGAHKINLLSQDHCEGRVIYWPAPVVAVVPIRVAKLGHISLPV
ncbi:MAG TPA: retropepsin-like aspartic protease, partial [Rhizomicrobium sp.]|nr:retropepsin-like aspartic protease [Rhizomicrobium sp.]